ncbi:MAG: hypothetical protein E3K36_06370 [Candidatus Brocadia sp.]|nr:hypothetical protein [Candidatus Brocadia sp.]
MAIRFKQYFKECKPIRCNGRKSKQCPEIPKRANGEYRTCGAWCVEYREIDGRWVSKIFPGINNKTLAQDRLEDIKARIRQERLEAYEN